LPIFDCKGIKQNAGCRAARHPARVVSLVVLV